MDEQRKERKVVTVLFCDLVGFTSRAEEMDPEDVAAMLGPYQARVKEELERYGGTVEKFIGDAVMAIFGAPVVHEDDPERAVRAALAIRDFAEEEQIELRIGITTGEALVTLGARPDLGETMATGDVVNTAARLQAAAPASEILVSPKTHEATKHAIEYADAEPVAAKGKARPVEVWRAVRPRARVEVERVHGTPLVGRVRELDLLADALARVRQESSAQLVTLIGVPGIGKSRLVFELFTAVEADPELITWRHGRCLPYGDGVTFWALGEMVKAEAGILETDSSDEAELKLAKAVEDEWVRSHLRPLVGLGAETELAGDRRSEAFVAWRSFFDMLADAGPVVLVFEDLHWADETLLDFIDHFVEWVGGVPVLVVCTARPELLGRRPGWGGGKPNSVTISLSPLSDAETARLIAELLRQPVLDAAQQSALLARAEGNPLYAEQYVRMLRERGDAHELPLPETVQGLIAARLDGLAGEEKSLLQDAAVLGKSFPLSGLSAVSGVDMDQAEENLHALERKEFVRRERRAPGSEEAGYVFRHMLVRDVAYGQIPRAERIAKHRRAAEWIESLERPEDHVEILAHHYLSALELAQAAGEDAAPFVEHARRALAGAGDRASELNAFRAAAHFYERALELWPEDDPDRASLLLRYGSALRWGLDMGEDVLAEAHRGLLGSGERAAAAEADVLLADLLWNRGGRSAADEHLASAKLLVQEAEPSRAKAYVLAQLARFSMLGGDQAEAIETGRDALELAEELRLDDIRSHVLTTVGVARMRSNDSGGLADVELGLELALAINSPREALRGYNNLIAVVGWLGDLRRERELWTEALAAAERFGEPVLASGLEGNRPSMLYEAGDWDQALRAAEEYIARVEPGQFMQETGCHSIRAEIRFARDDVEGALDDMATALERAREIGAPDHLSSQLCEFAHFQLELGNVEAAACCADEAVVIARRDEAAGLEFLEAALVLVSLGRADDLLGWLDSRPETRWIEAARHAAHGRLDRAATVYAEIGALPEEALARLRAAERFVAEGRRAEADEQIRQALAFYRSVRATRYIREGEELLAAAS